MVHFTGMVVRIISLPWLRKRSAAITFGRHVHLRPDYWASRDFPDQVGLLAHELTHARQYRRYTPPLFLALYILPYPLYFWRVSQHPLEKPAYRIGEQVEAQVRQGFSTPPGP